MVKEKKMTNVDELTDAELRVKLIEHGFPAVPITTSTRKLMVKKLKLKMAQTSSNNDSRQSLGKYSSGEDSDFDIKIKSRGRNTESNHSLMQPPPPSRTSIRKFRSGGTTNADQNLKKESRSSKLKSNIFTKSPSPRALRSSRNDFDTGSESESEISKSNSVLSRDSRNVSADEAYERVQQIRSRLMIGRTIDSSPPLNLTFENTNDGNLLSNFNKRLSQHHTTPMHYKNNVKEQDTNGSCFSSKRFNYSHLIPTHPKLTEETDDRLNSNVNSLKNNVVPFIVLGVAVLFFCLVGFIYVRMRSDVIFDSLGSKVPFCDSDNTNHKRGINCLTEDDVEGAMNLLKPLKTELKERAIKKFCDNPEISDRMNEIDVLKFVESKFGFTNQSRISRDFHNLQMMILKNPSWGLSVVQGAENEQITMENIDKLGFERFLTNSTSLIYLEPSMPWSCILVKQMVLVFKTVIILSGIFLVVYVSNVGYKKYSNQRKIQKNEMFSLVENILEILQNEIAVNENEQSYVVINHVRDMLIPVSERKAKDDIWKEAVKFINENESRVRTEIQMFEGEEYYVWRWVGSGKMSPNTSKAKTWQGQAFETQTGAVNSLPCSPTACLKIRGMVEDGDRNTQIIREAVLGKCASKCRILHCGIDNKMNCVYLKCADTSDAAIAYQNLHGWWYAGQLVTVKYLRLERYMLRFPDSPTLGPPYLKATLPVSDGWS